MFRSTIQRAPRNAATVSKRHCHDLAQPNTYSNILVPETQRSVVQNSSDFEESQLTQSPPLVRAEDLRWSSPTVRETERRALNDITQTATAGLLSMRAYTNVHQQRLEKVPDSQLRAPPIQFHDYSDEETQCNQPDDTIHVYTEEQAQYFFPGSFPHTADENADQQHSNDKHEPQPCL